MRLVDRRDGSPAIATFALSRLRRDRDESSTSIDRVRDHVESSAAHHRNRGRRPRLARSVEEVACRNRSSSAAARVDSEKHAKPKAQVPVGGEEAHSDCLRQ